MKRINYSNELWELTSWMSILTNNLEADLLEADKDLESARDNENPWRFVKIDLARKQMRMLLSNMSALQEDLAQLSDLSSAFDWDYQPRPAADDTHKKFVARYCTFDEMIYEEEAQQILDDLKEEGVDIPEDMSADIFLEIWNDLFERSIV